MTGCLQKAGEASARYGWGPVLVNERLWSVEEVAHHLGVSMRTMYDWRARNYGPRAKKLGRYLRYDPAEVRRWLDSLDEAA